MSLTLVTAPAQKALSLEELKEHVRVGDDEDALLHLYLDSAAGWLERLFSRAFVTQTWDYALDRFPVERFIRLPIAPVQSVTSITYYDEDLSTSTVFASSNYQVDTLVEPGVIALKHSASWPTDSLRKSSGVVIRFMAGYGDAGSDTPETIRAAIAVMVAQMYKFREPQVTETVVSPVQNVIDMAEGIYRMRWVE